MPDPLSPRGRGGGRIPAIPGNAFVSNTDALSPGGASLERIRVMLQFILRR
ncbi:TPA: dipeptide ABC transporter permease DppB, partial [Klebsiella pneumoniae]|nr:dipeptide ABC transporter permease DppB [Klebsiella pneumoniae]